jgi:Outer membrane protein beta-barrel domain
MMIIRRFTVLLLLSLLASSCSLAQKADASFVVGGSFVSDSKVTFGVPCLLPPCPTSPTFIDHVQTGDHVFLEGTPAVRLLNAKAVSLHLEVPFAGIPSQSLRLSTVSTVVFSHMSSLYITPSFRLKLLPGSPISPWASIGGGWAHYSVDPDITTNKGALQYGGGLDFKIAPHVGIRGEVRDFVTGSPNFGIVSLSTQTNQSGLHRHNILAGGGVVLNF